LVGEDSPLLVFREGGAVFAHVGAVGASLFDNPFDLELAVGAGDRVGIDEEALGEDADGREFLTRAEAARSDHVLDLVRDLEVDRGAGGLGDPHSECRALVFWLHCIKPMIQCFSGFVLLIFRGALRHGKCVLEPSGLA